MRSLRSIFVTLFGPLMVTAAIPYAIVRSGLASIPAAASLWHVPGLIVLAAGVAVACWCMWAFIFIGRGMPTSVDPPKVLVARGLYRITRNPMYGGVLLVIAGEALFLESALMAVYLGLVWLGLHLFVVIYEEPAMRRRFGAAYEDYCRVTPRWLPYPTAQRGAG